MSFGLGFVAGLGGAQREVNQREYEQQYEQEKQRNKATADLLHDFMLRDDVTPEVRQAALQSLMGFSQTKGMPGGKHRQSALDGLLTAFNAQRSFATPQIQQQRQQGQQTADLGGIMSGLDGLLPGASSLGGFAQQQGQQAAATPGEPRTGFLRPDEQWAEQEPIMRGKLALQQKFSAPPRPAYVEMNPGTILVDPTTGRKIADGPPPLPTRTSTADPTGFERFLQNRITIFTEKNTRPPNAQERDAIELQARKEYGRADDRPVSPWASSEPLVQVFDPTSNSVVYVPRSQASGRSAPRTVFDPSGTASVGGANVSLSPPPAIAAGIQQKLSGFESLESALDMVEQAAPGGKVGPMLGRISLVQARYLGGVGLSDEERRLLVLVEDAFAAKGFDEGGKQLTGPEREIFEGIMPRSSDTLPMILTKLKIARQRIESKRAATINAMPSRQRDQLTTTVPARTAAPPTTPAKFKVGDPVVYKGKPTKIKAVYPDGTYEVD